MSNEPNASQDAGKAGAPGADEQASTTQADAASSAAAKPANPYAKNPYAAGAAAAAGTGAAAGVTGAAAGAATAAESAGATPQAAQPAQPAQPTEPAATPATTAAPAAAATPAPAPAPAGPTGPTGPTGPSDGGNGGSGDSGSGDGEGEKKGGRGLLITLAVIVVLLLIGVFVAISQMGKSDLPVTNPNAAGYVDGSGAQENLPEPAPGENDAVSADGMFVTVNGKTAPVDQVQLTDEGVLLPPTDVSRLGWYSASTVPGSGDTGSTVITGHINDVSQGTGFAAQFTDLKVGDEIDVDVDGTRVAYTVSKGPLHVTKGTEFPEEINDRDNPNQLVLVTCGGQFVGGSLGYADNIIVIADPVDAGQKAEGTKSSETKETESSEDEASATSETE